MRQEIYLKLDAIFKSKKWPYNDLFGCSYYDKFVALLSVMTEEEQDMMINLTCDFKWIDAELAKEGMVSLLCEMCKTLLSTRITKVTILPIVSPKDEGKSKSSTVLFYELKIFKQSINTQNKGIVCSFEENYSKINGCAKNRCLCLIDDFVGQGQQAMEAIERLINVNGVKSNQIVVLCLGAMKEGYDLLSDNGIRIFSNDVFDKGIAKRPQEQREHYYRLMHNIEDRIDVEDEYRFGRHQSEALVKYMNTPNNTFPIYWQVKKNINAPFPRV